MPKHFNKKIALTGKMQVKITMGVITLTNKFVPKKELLYKNRKQTPYNVIKMGCRIKENKRAMYFFAFKF